jgi:Ca2+-transporting ATPase
MGVSGTEAAKEAADMVLTDDNFATIERAVEEGRGVFDNLKKFIVWTLPTNIGEGLVILVAVFAGALLPILPVQILWINMTTAVLLGLMLAFEPKEADIMARKPRDPREPLLTVNLTVKIFLVSLVLLAGAFGLFEHHLWAGGGRGASEGCCAQARTVAVTVFIVVEAFYLFNCRSFNKGLLRIGLFSNPWVWGGTAMMLLLQAAFIYLPFMNRIFHSAPISLMDWARIAAVGAAAYLIVGIEKAVTARVGKAEDSPSPADTAGS